MQLHRRHNALTFKLEKRILDYLAQKLHPYLSANQLSLLALFGSLLAAGAYIAASANLNLLHLSSLGIALHWFGDSLDGRVAVLRAENRPKYGHYLDHLLDAISLVIITFGINYSNLTLQSTWVWVLAIFLLIMIHSFLKASVTGEFELTIERFGPTEIRLLLIMVNFLVILTQNALVTTLPFPMTVLDLCGFAGAFILLVNFYKAACATLWGKNRIRE